MLHDRRVPELIAQAVRRLSTSGVRLERGLSDEEVSRVQDRFTFAFGPEHREFLQEVARAHLARVPILVPVFSHRYLASDPRFEPSPVFSVHQSDIIFYGDNLLDYIAHEFRLPPLHPSDRTHVPFWSDVANGAENRDL